jgi:hypothetical protein
VRGGSGAFDGGCVDDEAGLGFDVADKGDSFGDDRGNATADGADDDGENVVEDDGDDGGRKQPEARIGPVAVWPRRRSVAFLRSDTVSERARQWATVRLSMRENGSDRCQRNAENQHQMAETDAIRNGSGESQKHGSALQSPRSPSSSKVQTTPKRLRKALQRTSTSSREARPRATNTAI